MEEVLVRPGTYFNPQTEVLSAVDDSSSLDTEIFDLEKFEGADWVLVSDDLPIDEAKRDELLEEFQATAHGETGEQARAVAADAEDGTPPVPDIDEDEPTPAAVPVDDA